MSKWDNVKAFCSDNKSEIYLGIGIISAVVTIVSACVSTAKATDVISEHNDEIEVIEASDEPEENKTKMTRKVYKVTILRLAKLYAVPTLTAVIALFMTLAAYKSVSDELAVTSAELSAALATLMRYRQGVVERYGAQVDHDIMMGRTIEEVEEEIEDPKTGKKKKKIIKRAKYDPIDNDIYARLFSHGTSIEYTDNPNRNITFINGRRELAQRCLDGKDFYRVNDLYESFGMEVKINPNNPNKWIPNSIGWISKKIWDDLPEHWVYNGRDYFKNEYSYEINLGIDPARLEATKFSIFHGYNDDPYWIHPNCYPIDDILEFYEIYMKKNKRDAIKLDRRTLREFDQGRYFDM